MRIRWCWALWEKMWHPNVLLMHVLVHCAWKQNTNQGSTKCGVRLLERARTSRSKPSQSPSWADGLFSAPPKALLILPCLALPQPPPPRPPRREKAFIRLSRQEKEEALQRLADLQAEGERRHQRDKERQILRVSALTLWLPQLPGSTATSLESQTLLWGAPVSSRLNRTGASVLKPRELPATTLALPGLTWPCAVCRFGSSAFP